MTNATKPTVGQLLEAKARDDRLVKSLRRAVSAPSSGGPGRSQDRVEKDPAFCAFMRGKMNAGLPQPRACDTPYTLLVRTRKIDRSDRYALVCAILEFMAPAKPEGLVKLKALFEERITYASREQEAYELIFEDRRL